MAGLRPRPSAMWESTRAAAALSRSGSSIAESGMVMFFSCKAQLRSIVPSEIPGVNRRARRALAVLSVCDATSCIARPALLRPTGAGLATPLGRPCVRRGATEDDQPAKSVFGHRLVS